MQKQEHKEHKVPTIHASQRWMIPISCQNIFCVHSTLYSVVRGENNMRLTAMVDPVQYSLLCTGVRPSDVVPDATRITMHVWLTSPVSISGIAAYLSPTSTKVPKYYWTIIDPWHGTAQIADGDLTFPSSRQLMHRHLTYSVQNHHRSHTPYWLTVGTSYQLVTSFPTSSTGRSICCS